MVTNRICFLLATNGLNGIRLFPDMNKPFNMFCELNYNNIFVLCD